jgi:hypothetical protein
MQYTRRGELFYYYFDNLIVLQTASVQLATPLSRARGQLLALSRRRCASPRPLKLRPRPFPIEMLPPPAANALSACDLTFFRLATTSPYQPESCCAHPTTHSHSHGRSLQIPQQGHHQRCHPRCRRREAQEQAESAHAQLKRCYHEVCAEARIL